MNSVMQRYLRTAAALGALGLAFASTTAHAVGTPANTPISSSATVQFRVGNVDQTPVVSAPAAFVVDRVVNFAVASPNGTFVTLNPGAPAFVTFNVSHSGNGDQGFALTATNLTTGTAVLGGSDSADIATLEVWHHPTNAAAVFDAANPSAGGFVQGTGVNSIAATSTAVVWPVYVRVVAPTSMTAGQVVGVQLQARGAVAGSNGATLEVPSANPDVQNQVDVVIATAGNSATALSAFQVQAATVAVTKTSLVISDPFSASNPKAIPGAVVEYRITASNTGNATAQRVGFTDPVQAGTTFAASAYGASANVQIIQNGATNTCFAEAGSDTNGDGCFLSGSTLTVVPAPPSAVSLTQTGPNSSVEFRFRVTVN